MISSFTLNLRNVYWAIAFLSLGGSGGYPPAFAQEAVGPLMAQEAPLTSEQLQQAEQHNQEGIALVASGQYAEAVQAFNRALEIFPDSEKLYSNLGIALGYDRRFAEAVEAFEAALMINPQNWETYNNLGIALGSQEKYEEALAAFNQAIALNPDAPMSYHNSAVAYLKQQKWAEAIVSLEAARERYLALNQTDVVELLDEVLQELRTKVKPAS